MSRKAYELKETAAYTDLDFFAVNMRIYSAAGCSQMKEEGEVLL